jgi:hypothetical protein
MLLAAVAHRFAYCGNAARQRRSRHDAAVPDRRNEIILADDMIADCTK